MGEQNSRVANQKGGGDGGAEETAAGTEAPSWIRARRRGDGGTERREEATEHDGGSETLDE